MTIDNSDSEESTNEFIAPMIGKIDVICKAKCTYKSACYWADRDNKNKIQPPLTIMDTDTLFCSLYKMDI